MLWKVFRGVVLVLAVWGGVCSVVAGNRNWIGCLLVAVAAVFGKKLLLFKIW